MPAPRGSTARSGRLIGGSGALGWMTYARGNRQDYDEWARMGCEGWGYEVWLPPSPPPRQCKG